MAKNNKLLKACPLCGKSPQLVYTFPKNRNYRKSIFYTYEDPIYYISHHCDYVDYDSPRGKNLLKLITQWYEYCDYLEYNDQYKIDKEINYHKDKYIKLLARKIVENSRRYKDAK